MKKIENQINRKIKVPTASDISQQKYFDYLQESYRLMSHHKQYFPVTEDINSLELAYLIPEVPGTMLAIFVRIISRIVRRLK